MKIEFQSGAALPALSWCARVHAGGAILVRHGTGVETRDEGLVEGAWDGDFDRFDFDRAQSLAGSGIRLRGAVAIVVAPFYPLERIFLIANERELLISNSLPFVLAESGQRLDNRHAGYFFDFLIETRRGVAAQPAVIPTESGRSVCMYRCCNLEITPNLSVTRAAKTLAAPPEDFADYFTSLFDATAAIANNAGSPHRRRAYRLLASCSRGYDTTATAALASQVGCRTGLTFRYGASLAVHPLIGAREEVEDDSGAETLRALGMTVHEVGRLDVDRLPGHPRAEFYVSPVALTDASTSAAESIVSGSLFVTGRHGERYWGPTRRCRRPTLSEIDDCLLSGHSLGEFRLRADFIHLPIPYVGALHGPAIYRITHSPEMRPWKLGTGYYDRPIARRIAEEAGVPRGAFGQKKTGAGFAGRNLPPHSEDDFQSFVQSEVPRALRGRLNMQPLDARMQRMRKLTYLRTHYAHWPLAAAAMSMLGAERLHALWNSIHLYRFHWGLTKVTSRYR